MPKFAQKFKNMWNPPEDEFEYEEGETVEEQNYTGSGSADYEDVSSYSEPAYQQTPSYTEDTSSRGDNVMNFSSSSNNVQVILFKPMDYREDITAIADELVHQNTVVLNLEVTPKDVARRVLDFLGGVAYAKNGKVKRISTNTYIITPANVDLVGNDGEEAESDEL